MLQRFIDAGLKLNLEKCHFLLQQVEYLGHIISSEGLAPSPSKVKAVLDYSRSGTPKQVRAFLGLVSFYRRYVKQFSTIASPLYALTEKGKIFDWNTDHENAFNVLTKMLAKDVVLAFPNFKQEFQITTDASGIGLGAVLSQIQDSDEERPIAFASRVLSKAEKRYSTIERELLAIVYALEIFRPYLFGQEFSLITDHEPLTYMKTIKYPSDRLVR